MTLQEWLDYAALGLSPVPIAGDVAGVVADGYRMASDPKERTLLNTGLLALGALPVVPSLGAVKGAMRAADHIDDGLDAMRATRAKKARRNASHIKELGLSNRNTAEQRAKAMGFERGYFRGGASPVTDKTLTTAPTGAWYSTSADAAAEYAKPDVREYAIRGPLLNLGDTAERSDLARMARLLSESQDTRAHRLASDLMGAANAADEVHTNRAIWQGMSNSLGEDQAGALLNRAGFTGVKNLNNPGDVFMTDLTAIRDANRAAFDPTMRKAADIYGRATVPALIATGLAGGLGAFGLARAWRGNDSQNEPSPPRTP